VAAHRCDRNGSTEAAVSRDAEEEATDRCIPDKLDSRRSDRLQNEPSRESS